MTLKPSNRWIKTVDGYAGRTGFITRAPKGQNAKFCFTTYDLRENHYADLIGDLKKLADGEFC